MSVLASIKGPDFSNHRLVELLCDIMYETNFTRTHPIVIIASEFGANLSEVTNDPYSVNGRRLIAELLDVPEYIIEWRLLRMLELNANSQLTNTHNKRFTTLDVLNFADHQYDRCGVHIPVTRRHVVVENHLKLVNGMDFSDKRVFGPFQPVADYIAIKFKQAFNWLSK